MIEDKTGQFEKEIQHWLKADFNGDKVLNKNEFLAFYHPEHTRKQSNSWFKKCSHLLIKIAMM